MVIYKDHPELYDYIYSSTDENIKNSLDFLQWFFNYAEIDSQNFNDKILDIGSGTGRLLIPITEKGFTIEGIDPFEEMNLIALKKAKNLNVDIKVTRGSFETLSFNENFKLIFSMNGSMAYLYSSEDFITAFKNIHSALKPDGYFLVHMMNFYGLIKIYKSPEPQFMEINGKKVTFIHSHKINLKKTIWKHTTHIFMENQGQNVETYKDIQELTMINPRELIYYANMANLECIEQLESYIDRPDDRKTGIRMILIFQKS